MFDFLKKDEKLNTEESVRSVANDVEYFVIKNKGVVVCKLHNCETIAADRIIKYTGMKIKNPYKYFIDNIFVGVAKCSPDDTFNEEYGKKLALTKAKASRGKAVNNMIKCFIEDKEKLLNRLKEHGIHEVPNVKAFLEEED